MSNQYDIRPETVYRQAIKIDEYHHPFQKEVTVTLCSSGVKLCVIDGYTSEDVGFNWSYLDAVVALLQRAQELRKLIEDVEVSTPSEEE